MERYLFPFAIVSDPQAWSAVDAARRAGYSIPHPACVNMLRNATVSGFGRNLASLVFGVNYYKIWTYDYFYVDYRSTQH